MGQFCTPIHNIDEDAAQNNAKLDAADWDCQRGEGGRWIKTTGRPVGSRNRLTRKSARAITDLHDLVFARLRDLIEAGHPETVRFAASALLPTGGRVVQLDDISPEGLTDAVAAGEISPVELRQLATSIEKLRRIQDMQALDDRLVEVERLLKDGSL